jgi:hypothetical protein
MALAAATVGPNRTTQSAKSAAVARSDRCATGRAPAAQCEPACNGYQIAKPQNLSAGRAMRTRLNQVKARGGGDGLAPEIGGVVLPLPLEHSGQAINHHVQKTADQQTRHTSRHRGPLRVDSGH